MTVLLPPSVVGFIASRRRAAGEYNRETLALYAAASSRSNSPQVLLRYALFRRDLGRTLPRRWIPEVLAAARRLRGTERELALALVVEVAPDVIGQLAQESPETLKSRLPAIVALADSPDGPHLSLLGQLHRNQSLWRDQFLQRLLEHHKDGICVVGNAATLKGSGLGARIDDAGLVIRFNLFKSEETDEVDIGARADIWVVSPGFRGASPQDVEWMVVTGPDMRYRLRDWQPVLAHLKAGRPVLTVPLPVWKALVQRLEAPPSAGILMLAWLRNHLLSSWSGITNIGIGSGLSASGRYHSASRWQRAVSRHNWPREQALINYWKQEGMETLLAEKSS